MSTPVSPGAGAGADPPTPGRRRGRRLGRLAAALLLLAVLAVAAAALLPPSDPLLGGAPLAAGTGPSPSEAASSGPRLPVAEDLLDRADIARLGGPGRWRVASTTPNTSGTGINSVCQQSRFADPDGYAALVRTFRSSTPRRSAVQTVEVSRSRAQAAEAYDTTLAWYAGCQVARLRVLSAHRVEEVGDRAQVLTLRVYDDPVTTYSVAVARTGALTTTTVGTTVGSNPPPVGRVVDSLADAVRKLCDTDLAGACVRPPTYQVAPPPPAGPGEARGTLAAADLPPVGRIDEPWVGTRGRVPRGNPAATTCDRADPAGAGATRRRTRTYLVPQARLPERFGLTETYAVFRTPRAARAFLTGVRRDVAGCERRDLATEVSTERRPVRGPRLDSSQWRLTTTVSGGGRVGFRVGFVRVGRAVAQLTFTSSPTADLTDDSFGTLLGRAGERLGELRPAP